MSMTKDDPNLLVLLLCNIDRSWFPHEIEAAVHEGVKSVAGHLTIFVTRTRGRFWSIRPFRLLFLAVVGTQAVATLIAVYGVFMTPMAGVVRGPDEPNRGMLNPDSLYWICACRRGFPSSRHTRPFASTLIGTASPISK